MLRNKGVNRLEMPLGW